MIIIILYLLCKQNSLYLLSLKELCLLGRFIINFGGLVASEHCRMYFGINCLDDNNTVGFGGSRK